MGIVLAGLTLVAIAVGPGDLVAVFVVVSRLAVVFLVAGAVLLGDAILFCCYGALEGPVVKSVN